MDLDKFLQAARDLDTGDPISGFDADAAHENLLKRQGPRSEPYRDPDEIERAVRERMRTTLDDREVIFQVAYARDHNGCWLCIMGGPQPIAPGPATRDVHEAEMRRMAERDARRDPDYVFGPLPAWVASLTRSLAGIPVPSATTIKVGVEANCPRPGG